MYFRLKLMICMRNVILCIDRLVCKLKSGVSCGGMLLATAIFSILPHPSPLIRHGYCYNLNALLSLQVMSFI